MIKLAINGGTPVRTRPFRANGVIGEEEQAAVSRVIQSQNLFRFGGGERAVERLESALAERLGGARATAVNSGTSALHTALAAAGISPGDEVIVPAITWFATATACLHQGAVPVFADVDPATGMMTEASVSACLTSRTQAVLVVHLFGYPAEVAALRRLTDRHGLVLIEDAAQALGASVGGQCVGTFGDVGAFSLQQTKSITSGDGGFTLARTTELGKRAAMFADHGMDRSAGICAQFLGYNYRMTELQGAVALAQLDRLDEFNQRRRYNCKQLIDRIGQIPGLACPPWSAETMPAWWLFPIKFDQARFTITRDQFITALQKEGIPAGTYPERPVYLEPVFLKRSTYSRSHFPFPDSDEMTYRVGLCEAAERYLAAQITFPCHHALDGDDMNDIATAVEKVAQATLR